MKLSELRSKLAAKEDSILTPELDALLEQHAELEKRIKDAENRVKNELKLKWILNREYAVLMKEKRVNAKEEQIKQVEDIVSLTPDEVEGFIEKNSYGMGNWRSL